MTTKNPFFGHKSKQTVHMLATCQSQIMESLMMYGQAEMHHMETVARMYLDANGAIPAYDKVVLRDTEFMGGKRSHPEDIWP